MIKTSSEPRLVDRGRMNTGVHLGDSADLAVECRSRSRAVRRDIAAAGVGSQVETAAGEEGLFCLFLLRLTRS